MAENVKVAVRVRPFLAREGKQACVVSMTGQHTLVKSKPPKTFAFDASYWSHDPGSPSYASQDVVMRDIGDPILQNALSGYNGCLFTYGQTGSGKTYSLFGSEHSPGVVPQTVSQLFMSKKECEASPFTQVRVWISYLEIYNDHIHDLLSVEKHSPANLTIHDHPKIGIYVPGLQEVPCESQDDVQRLLTFGTRRRAVAATQMNDYSSRSHAIFVIRLQRLDGERPAADEHDDRSELHARVNLIDLAGSERLFKSEVEGKRLKEGCSINKGLSALALVIRELSERQSRSGQTISGVPFRASKLTWLLKDSLAGNSKTHMLANISPAVENVAETLSTLRFAASVKRIKTTAIQNKHTRDELICTLKRELEALRTKVADASSEQLREQERLVGELTTDYAVQVEQARLMDEARGQVLKDMALSRDEIHTAFGVDKMTPCLLNISSDPALAGCLLFYIPMGTRRTIGSGIDNSIRVQALGICEQLCVIENHEKRCLTIWKCSEEGSVLVNGLQAGVGRQEGQELKNGYRIILGRTIALRVSVPAASFEGDEESTDSPCQDVDVLLQDLEHEAMIEGSPSWIALRDQLAQVMQQMPADAAKAVCEEVRRGAILSDEANEITKICRPRSLTSFDVRLMSGSVPSVVCVMWCSGKIGNNDLPVSYWSLDQMRERVDRMREYYQTCTTIGHYELDAFDDPWEVLHPAEVWEKVRDLQVRFEDVEAQNVLLKSGRERALARGLMLWRGGRSDHTVRLIFSAWMWLSRRDRSPQHCDPRQRESSPSSVFTRRMPVGSPSSSSTRRVPVAVQGLKTHQMQRSRSPPDQSSLNFGATIADPSSSPRVSGSSSGTSTYVRRASTSNGIQSSAKRVGRSPSRATGRALASKSTGINSSPVSSIVGTSLRGTSAGAARVATARGRTQSSSSRVSRSIGRLSGRARAAMASGTAQSPNTRLHSSPTPTSARICGSMSKGETSSSSAAQIGEDLDAMSFTVFTSMPLTEPMEAAPLLGRSALPKVDVSTDLLSKYKVMRNEVADLMEYGPVRDQSVSAKQGCRKLSGEDLSRISNGHAGECAEHVANECVAIRSDIAALCDEVAQQSAKMNQVVDIQKTLLGRFEKNVTLEETPQETLPSAELAPNSQEHAQSEPSSRGITPSPLVPKPLVSPRAFSSVLLPLHPAWVMQSYVTHPPPLKHVTLPTGSPKAFATPVRLRGDADVPWTSVARPPNSCHTYQQKVYPATCYSGGLTPRKTQSSQEITSMVHHVASSSSSTLEAGKPLPVLLGTPINRMSYQTVRRNVSPSLRQNEGKHVSTQVASPSSNRHSFVESPREPISQEHLSAKDTSRPVKRAFADCVHKVTAQALREFRKQRSESVKPPNEQRFTS